MSGLKKECVAHERLLRKLEKVGLNGHLSHWIRAFLTSRVKCVTVESAPSSWTKASSGIPQGSVLSTLLFVIFINDMPDEVKYNLCNCKHFAADCKLYGAVIDDEVNKMQMDLKSLESWSHIWQLPFNAAKCNAFGYSNPKRTREMNNVVPSDHEKDL